MPTEKNWWFNYPWDFDNKIYILKEQTTIIQLRKEFFILKAENFPTSLYFPFRYNDYPLVILN